ISGGTSGSATTTQPTTTTAKVSAIPSKSSVTVNGSKVALDAYNINGSNYFKLRDLAMVVSGTSKQFGIAVDGTTHAVSLTSNAAYIPAGDELTASAGTAVKAAAATSKITLDGQQVQISAYNIGGSNYFKLRDIAKTADFKVSWDAAANTISIDTSGSYADSTK
ncbi:hypothetical protein KC345_g11349, partial [Hortaea werneckii]